MPPSEDDAVLTAIMPMPVSDVPGAGHQELVRYGVERGDNKVNFVMGMILAAISGIITAMFLSEGIIAYGVSLLLMSFFLADAGVRFWRLAAGPKSWQALPEGASETTALLEDGATKSIREWNEDVRRWNMDLTRLHAEMEAWRKRSEDPSLRPGGWSEESHGIDRDTLMAQGLDLAIRRKGLNARQQKIQRVISVLDATMRKAEQESQDGGPESK